MWMWFKSCFNKSDDLQNAKGESRMKKENVSDETQEFSVNDEYVRVIRTDSYIKIYTRMQSQLKNSIHDPHFDMNFFQCLLEPRQEVILAMIHGKIHLHNHLLLDYFNASFETCMICGNLLRDIGEARTNHKKIRKTLRLKERVSGDYDEEQYEFILQEFLSFSKLDNPMKITKERIFYQIQNIYEDMFVKLKSNRKTMAKRIKSIGFYKRTSRIKLETLYDEIDATVKGVYILNTELETLCRLVIRLFDEIEHMKAMIGIYLRKENKEMLKKLVTEFECKDSCFLESLDELEEQVYLCLLTINKVRGFVVEKLMGSQ